MAGFLSYWKNYWQKYDDPSKVQPDWSTDSKVFYDAVNVGDTIWGVIPGPEASIQEWRLLETVVVTSKRASGETTDYGRYHFAGDATRSRIFDPRRQPDFTPVLWLLDFDGGTPIRSAGAKIGQSLQSHGARRLSHSDIALLEHYADALASTGHLIT